MPPFKSPNVSVPTQRNVFPELPRREAADDSLRCARRCSPVKATVGKHKVGAAGNKMLLIRLFTLLLRPATIRKEETDLSNRQSRVRPEFS